MRDTLYANVPFRLNEMTHHYGPHVHLVGNPFLSLRLDRGMSPPEVFGTEPGALWEKERGLDDRQYIVPGGGGFGEIMNNAYV